ncbi:MAG TPA: hypothetical protein VLY04_01380 [Bryobacteraceae bacterium]|nr:hypothetical protein [Bryobacteraceae bacterium]
MRFLAVMGCVPAILLAQDAREIVRRSVAQDAADIVLARNYTYQERQEQRELDGSGKVKSSDAHTYAVTLMEGSPYRRLIARNDRPLPANEQQKEDERLHRSTQDRSQETPEQRQQRIADWHRRQESQREPAREIPDAFDLRLTKNESLDGRPVYVIEGMPKPGYKPKSKGAFFLPKVKARLWIDQRDYQCIKAEFEMLEPIYWGGILVRLSKGDRFSLEFTRVDGGAWLPKRMLLSGSARIMLVKAIHGDFEIAYSDYKKYPAEAVVSAVR